MKLAHDYPDVLKKAWSVRFMIAAFGFSAAEIALPMLDGILPVPAGVFAALTGICTGAAFVPRLVAQKNLDAQPTLQGVSFHDGDLVIYSGRLYRAVQPAEAA